MASPQEAKIIQIKDDERDWVRRQIDTFYYDANPVSAILDVNVNLQHSEKDEQKIKGVKQDMLEILHKMLRCGSTFSAQLTDQCGNPTRTITQKIVVNFQTLKLIGELPRYWISRDGHLDATKAQYVKAIVDTCNRKFARWATTKTNWESVSSASIHFLISKPIDFKVLNVVMPK